SRVLAGNRAFIFAGSDAVATIQVSCLVVDIDGLTCLEVAATTTSVNDGHIVQVVSIAIRDLLEPHCRAVVEEFTFTLVDLVQLADKTGELLCVEAIDRQQGVVGTWRARSTHTRSINAVRDVVVLVLNAQATECVVSRILEEDNAISVTQSRQHSHAGVDV